MGANTFCLICVADTGSKKENVYADVYNHYDYTGALNVKETFNLVTLEASLDSVGTKATSDLMADNISIGNAVAKIPNDLFAWYGPEVGATYTPVEVDQNQVLNIPDSVKSIGINAFYLYNGKTLVLPETLEMIEDYAFAAYHGSDFVIPAAVTTIKAGAFRDFAGKITMDSCPQDKSFAPNATIVDKDNNEC